jgi:ABC-type multidrug transport system fused ATPase/permease subunit
VCFTYPSGRTVLSGLDLTVRSGECLALWGPYGRGSSTLLNLLFGLLRPDSGFIALDGLDVRSWALEALRSRVCLVRHDDLVAGSLLENVRLGRDDIGIETVSAALAAAGLLDDALSLPQGLDTPLISGGLPLSSRQRLRLLIARAIVLSPSLLLLDDLLDGMDPDTQREIFAVLRDPNRRWTVIVTTRDPSVAELCERYVEISADGRALAERTLRTRVAGS